jgi:hypothetical protein
MFPHSSPPNPEWSGEPATPAEVQTASHLREPVDEGTGLPAPRAGGRHRVVAPSRFSLILIAIVAGSALFMGGFTLGAHVATTPGTPADQEARFGPFWDVYSLIQSKYAGSPRPNQDQLVQAAINGMMQSLNDPWSYYQGPADFANSLLDVGSSSRSILPARPVAPRSAVAASWPSARRSPARRQKRRGSNPAT